MDVELPGDGWAGQPAVDAAAITAHVTARLLGMRENVGCDLAAAYPIYMPWQSEPVGEWQIIFDHSCARCGVGIRYDGNKSWVDSFDGDGCDDAVHVPVGVPR